MKKIVIRIFCIFLFVEMFVGCASTKKIENQNGTEKVEKKSKAKKGKKKKKAVKEKKELSVYRPSNVDMNGAKSIAIMTISGANDFSSKCTANYITISLENNINFGEYLTLLSSDSIYESDLSSIPDVYIKGEITKYQSTLNSTVREDTGEPITYYGKTVDFGFSFKIIDTLSKKILYSEEILEQVVSDFYNNKYAVPDAYEILQPVLEKLVMAISHDIQPYREIKDFTLIEYKNKKSDVVEEMDDAYQFAVNGMIEESFEKYIELYSSYRIFEAGYNATILLATMGNYDEAYKLTNNLISTFKKKNRVPPKLRRLRKGLIDTERAMSLKRQKKYNQY